MAQASTIVQIDCQIEKHPLMYHPVNAGNATNETAGVEGGRGLDSS